MEQQEQVLPHIDVPRPQQVPPQKQQQQQQQQPTVAPPQYHEQPYPAVQPMMVAAAPQQFPTGVQYMPPQPGVQFVPGQQGLPPTQTVAMTGKQQLPSHNLILTTIVTIGCLLLNITSLIIGASAMVCAILAYNALKNHRYSTTKYLGHTAVTLSVVNIVYTGIVSTLVVGLTIGLYCDQYRYYDDDEPYQIFPKYNCP